MKVRAFTWVVYLWLNQLVWLEILISINFILFPKCRMYSQVGVTNVCCWIKERGKWESEVLFHSPSGSAKDQLICTIHKYCSNSLVDFPEIFVYSQKHVLSPLWPHNTWFYSHYIFLSSYLQTCLLPLVRSVSPLQVKACIKTS